MAERLTYGFVDYAHSVNEVITTIGLQATYDAVVESARRHSEEIREIYSALVSEGTEAQELVKIAADAELQPITDNTQPDPVRFLGQYTQAYPLKQAAIGFGVNRVSKLTMTVGDANRQTLQMLKADARFLKRHILAALMHPSSYTFTDQKHGALTVLPLANGDSTLYEQIDGTRATATHYGAQSNDIGDGADNPFPTVYAALNRYESNRGRPVICYAADDLHEDIRGITGYIEVSDPAILEGITADRINSASIPDVGPGEEIIGRVDNVWIAKWAAIPSGYMVFMVMGTDDPVVRHRIMPQAELQGFFAERNNGDGNLEQLNLIRYGGFGVRNRLAAYCYLIGAGSYSAPSAYTTLPLVG